jgi:HPt (histidine-containing phosphotransfer) domain-containing protein
MAPVLDMRILDELGEDLGDADFLREIVVGYLAELPDRQQEMRSAFERGDRPGLRARAHSLGSASLMLGAVNLAAACASMERSALTVDSAGLAQIFDEWVSACRHTEPALSEWLSIQGSNR